MSHKKAEEFREKALAAKLRAADAKTEESRRAWEIVARGWKTAADREEAKDTLELTGVDPHNSLSRPESDGEE